MASKHRSSQVF